MRKTLTAKLIVLGLAACTAAAISCSVTIESGVEAHHQTDQESTATPAAAPSPTQYSHRGD
jgi:hypothetical protein